MGKHTAQKNDLSGTKKLYLTKFGLVEAMPYFLYEVRLCKYWKGGFSQIASKTFCSNKYLNIKKSSSYKKYDGYFIEKSIAILGMPYNFIREYNLPEYNSSIKPIKKRKKK